MAKGGGYVIGAVERVNMVYKSCCGGITVLGEVNTVVRYIMKKLQQMTSEVYQMKVGRCVLVVVQIHYFI